MNVTIWANHDCNILGVSNNLHLTELIEILRNPCLQGIASFTTTMYPTAFSIIQVQPSNVVHGVERRCQRSHQALKRRGSHSEVVSVRTLSRLQGIHAIRVPWDDCL